MGEGYRVRHHSIPLMMNRGETYMTLIEVANSSLKQYYYNVVKELHNVRRDDIITTEHFYFDVLCCYERMLDVGKCVDNLIEMQGENNG